MQLSATATRRPAARFASITWRALSTSSAGRTIVAGVGHSILREPHGRDGLRRDAFAAAGEAEPLGRRRLDANPRLRQPQQARSASRIASRYGPIRGASQMMVTSTWSIRPPACSTRSRACSRNSDEAAPRHCGSDGGKWSPISPAPSAPRIASVSAWRTTSASLWPVRPLSCGMRTPPSHSASPGREGVDVEAEADARGSAGRLRRGGNRPRRSASRAPDRLRRARRRGRPRGRSGRRRSPRRRARRRGRARIASKRKACGVCTRTRSSRGTGLAVAPRQACRRPARAGTAPSWPSSASSSRSITARGKEGAGGVVDQHALRARRAPRARCGTDCRRVAPPMIGAGRARSPTASR